MQNPRNLDPKTAEIEPGTRHYYKCLLLPSELFRAVFFRRLPFKSFDTSHVNMLLREHGGRVKIGWVSEYQPL